MGLKNFLKVTLFICLSATFGFSQAAQRSFDAIQNPAGGGNYAKIGPNASVFVCTYNAQLTCNSGNYASIFSDVNLTEPINQALLPVTSDINGVYQYFINAPAQVVEKVCFTASQCQSYGIYFRDRKSVV